MFMVRHWNISLSCCPTGIQRSISWGQLELFKKVRLHEEALNQILTLCRKSVWSREETIMKTWRTTRSFRKINTRAAMDWRTPMKTEEEHKDDLWTGRSLEKYIFFADYESVFLDDFHLWSGQILIIWVTNCFWSIHLLFTFYRLRGYRAAEA